MRALIALPLLLALVGCESMKAGTSAPLSGGLTGTSWRLVSFQSSDDAIGTLRPTTAEQYTLTFEREGRAAFKLDCNRGSGTWHAEPKSDDAGPLSFGPVATTKMMCPPSPLGPRLPGDIDHIRSYRLIDGQLYLSLEADGGIYRWEATKP
ncbi:META domain-containing protein [Asticcacaulis sp.]|uniref:META domain-containing protein n=1 Tax=Asticcacaulis sp. TaxID=1872648 RepID=UPI0031E143E4